MTDGRFRRVIYTSKASGGAGLSDLPGILAQSRTNNGLDGLSGLLWTDGERYVQLLEGPPESVTLTLERILVDPRHNDVRLISDTKEEGRAFGDWTMANLPGDPKTADPERIELALSGAPAPVKETFSRLMGNQQGKQ